jgi:hypothetical protein
MLMSTSGSCQISIPRNPGSGPCPRPRLMAAPSRPAVKLCTSFGVNVYECFGRTCSFCGTLSELLRNPFRGASRGDLLPCGSARGASVCSAAGIGSVFDVGRSAVTQTVGDSDESRPGNDRERSTASCFETREQNDRSGGSGILFRRRWTAANLADAGLLPEAASASKNHGFALTQPRRGRLQVEEAPAGLPIAARQTCGTRN